MITAETITDEQIRELRESASEEGSGADVECPTCIGTGKIRDASRPRRCFNCGGSGLRFSFGAADLLNLCDEALGDFEYGDAWAHLPMAAALRLVDERRQWSRARCAEILNERAKDGAK